MEEQTLPEVKNENFISISKSLFKKIVIIVIGVALIAAFFAGYFVVLLVRLITRKKIKTK